MFHLDNLVKGDPHSQPGRAGWSEGTRSARPRQCSSAAGRATLVITFQARSDRCSPGRNMSLQGCGASTTHVVDLGVAPDLPRSFCDGGTSAPEPCQRWLRRGSKCFEEPLDSCSWFGERHRSGLLHEIVKNGSGSNGNDADDQACDGERAHRVFSCLPTIQHISKQQVSSGE